MKFQNEYKKILKKLNFIRKIAKFWMENYEILEEKLFLEGKLWNSRWKIMKFIKIKIMKFHKENCEILGGKLWNTKRKITKL